MSLSDQIPVVIVIGASAGGLEPLGQVIRDLPADLPAAVCVIVHFPATANSLLPQILNRTSQLPAAHAAHGQPLQAGRVYTARPDQHMLVGARGLVLSRGPRYNGYRPAIDPLFESAARTHGPRLIGVILSGTLNDGTLGLQAVQAHGGATIVQEPSDAAFDAMPRNALAVTTPDLVLPAAQIGAALARLAQERAGLPAAGQEAQGIADMNELMHNQDEANQVALDIKALENGGRSGQPSMFTCPDCGGVLWEVHNGDLLRYRCHVGHAYSAEALRAEQANSLEEALWTAVRRLEESASLARRLAHRAHERQHALTARHFEARAQEDEERAGLVRRALEVRVVPPDSEVAALDSAGGATG